MIPDYIKLSAEELLDEFGSGRHKPGSGSAVALLGLVSCKLIKTVVSLSNNREPYKNIKSRFKKINNDINNNIEPKLFELFQEDSNQFHNVITTRRERDGEKDFEKKIELEDKALSELKAATEIPLDIAEKSLILSEYAIEIFDNGFKAARGDSAVAISSALSAASGAISVIYLNLTSFWGDDWAIDIMRETDELNRRHQSIQIELQNRIKDLQGEAVESNAPIEIKKEDIRSPELVGQKWSSNKIEEVARNLQNIILDKRHHIWKDDVPKTRLDALQPKIIFEALRYQLKTEDTLGQYILNGELIEIAGYIDSSKNYVGISAQFPTEVQNFTIAHELGHALLHDDSIGLHRDRPLDGSTVNTPRNQIEIEADKFASYFLMPRTVVKKIFRNYFRTESFSINQDTAFALGYSLDELGNKYSDLRDLSRILADATYYDPKHFTSLAKRFRVSVEAMAIRLEELNLVKL